MKQSSWPDVAAINQKNYYTYAYLHSINLFLFAAMHQNAD